MWVSELEGFYIVWANDAAVEFWNASSRAELFARDLMHNVPPRIHEDANTLRERILAGEPHRRLWTYYPGGEAVTVSVDLHGVRLADGRLAVMSQAQSLMDTTSAYVQRAMAMTRHSETVTAFVARSGELLACNDAAHRDFPETERWSSWFCEPAEAEAVLEATLGGGRELLHTHARVVVDGVPRWHSIQASILRDPVTTELALLVEHRDETERVEAEALATTRGEDLARLQAALTLVEEQRQEILALSAPVLDVGDRTLAVVLTGSFSAEQSERLTSELLEAVRARGTRRVILDFTGLARVEGELARRIEALVRCVELLGARPVITGIRPELARALVEAGIAFERVPTLRSLAAELRLSD